MVDIEFWGWLIGCSLGVLLVLLCEYLGAVLCKTFHA